MTTIILGGGIIGLSTAYYLSLPTDTNPNPPNIVIIDSASSLLLSASAYAGGFLALDWFAPPVASLGALSFKLHRELAQEHDGQKRWGYTGSHVYSLSIDDRGFGKGRKKERGGDWLLEGTSRAETVGENTVGANGKGAGRDEMLNEDGTPAWITQQSNGTLETIAGTEECGQVEPRELCEFLIGECEKRGVKVKTSSTAKTVMRGEDGKIAGVLVEVKDGEERIDCSNLLLAAGTWTPRVYQKLFPESRKRIPIDPLAGHSILFRSPRYKTPFASPNSSPLKSGEKQLMSYAVYCAPCERFRYAPEAFARLARDGEAEVWIGGLNDSSMKLPETADAVKAMTSRKDLDDLKKTTVVLTGLSKEGSEINDDDLETRREGLCFRPVSRTGLPILSKVKDKSGLFIASGHGPWGISLSLGTGKVMSEMIRGERTSADIGSLRL